MGSHKACMAGLEVLNFALLPSVSADCIVFFLEELSNRLIWALVHEMELTVDLAPVKALVVIEKICKASPLTG
ncbi:conserved hypothetical protein [Ricinus communis]|uniref:Uncharacterized protein n=1 Tax=Ricinus communis TaxID=3988 RepID=B9T0B3_RICCO|nr:conserved hypothetical protein [Ricinus communis]